MRKFDELSKAEKIVIIQHAQKFYNTNTEQVIFLMKNADAYEEPGVSIRLRPDKWSEYNWGWFVKQSQKIPELFQIAEHSIPYYQLDTGPSNAAILWFAMCGMGLALLVYWFIYHP